MANGATQAVENATRLSEIGFPEFTAQLITDTFNAITVDGECSTNDTVFALANGASGVVIDDEQDVVPSGGAEPAEDPGVDLPQGSQLRVHL